DYYCGSWHNSDNHYIF
nr:immunoglobulin light chain junction region [Macaca mulatta]